MLGWDKHFDAFIENLERGLAGNLPGMAAQYRMVPPGREKPDLQHILETQNPRLAGVLALLYPKKGEPHIALMQRNSYPGVHSNQISFPGGQFEPKDANLTETALRETHEEIGVPPETIRVFGKLSRVYIPPSHFMVQPVVGVCVAQPTFNPDSREVQLLIEIPFSHFLGEQHIVQINVAARGKEVKVPAYQIDNHIIWGATAMMLAELAAIFEGK